MGKSSPICSDLIYQVELLKSWQVRVPHILCEDKAEILDLIDFDDHNPWF